MKEKQNSRLFIAHDPKNNSWIFNNYTKVKDNLSITAQIERADKKLKTALKKEDYLKAAKYRDLLIELKKQ